MGAGTANGLLRLGRKVELEELFQRGGSADDRAVTRQLVDAGRLLDIPVDDHVIVGRETYLSFAEQGLLG